MESQIFTPMFKGIVNCPGDKGASLLSGKNDAGDQLTGVEYINLVREMNTKKGSPQLVQDIARAHAAAVLAHGAHTNGKLARLVSVEGCVHTVGSERVSGSQLMGRLWENVVPLSVMESLPPVELSNHSVCTVQEVRAILGLRNQAYDHITAVTDPYHQARVEATFAEENKAPNTITVSTPEMALSGARLPQSELNFLGALMKAAKPSEEFVKAEAKAESRINGPLHSISRHVERWTGFSPEIFLAERLRKRA